MTTVQEKINELEAQIYPQLDGQPLTQFQINEIERQLDNLYDRSGQKRKWTLKQLHKNTATKVLPE